MTDDITTKINRQLRFQTLSEAEAAAAIAVVEGAFGSAWLHEPSGRHKIQQLWKRSDTLASIELITLGDSLRTLDAIDSQWVNARVSDVKESNPCHGFLFEILGVAALARGGMNIKPTKGNKAGVDAVVSFPDGFEIRLSLKNHDISSHEQFFRDQAIKTRQSARDSFQGKAPGYQLALIANKPLVYPDWDKVRDGIDKWAKGSSIFKNDLSVAKKAAMFVSPLLGEAGALSRSYLSDTFFAAAPHHPNEQKNFLDKIDQAASNMRKHSPRSPAAANVVFMRVHPTAGLDQLAAYAEDLLNGNDDPGVDGLLLYQVAVTRLGDQSSVTNHLRYIGSPRWTPSKHLMKFVFMFGQAAIKQTEMQLHIGDMIIDMKGNYSFQRGDHFYQATSNGGVLSGNANHIASGIHTHAIFSMDGQEIRISGRFPPDDELVVL